MSFDLNYDKEPLSKNVTVYGVLSIGNHMRVRRIKVFNTGSRFVK